MAEYTAKDADIIRFVTSVWADLLTRWIEGSILFRDIFLFNSIHQ